MASTVLNPPTYTSSGRKPVDVAITLVRHALADWRYVLVGVMILSAGYVAWNLERGWVPHDEGALGQSAVRVLDGEVPHRDFDELYTGGLTYVNAAAFRIFGTSLIAMRLVLFVVFLAWVPAVFYIASRLARPAVAAGMTLLCVVWSLPNYPAPLPSWYNLFLTVFGLAALYRWLEVGRSRWLVLAGIAAGLSILVKVIGLYVVAGGLLFLVFQAHEQSRAESEGDGQPLRAWAYASFVTASLLLFAAALLMLVSQKLRAPEIVQFVLPGSLISGLLIWREWTDPAGDSRARFVALARLVAPFLAGVALPVALFLILFASADAIGALINGVFVAPSKRIGVASVPMLPLRRMLPLVPVVLLLLAGRYLSGRTTRIHVLGLAVLLGAYLLWTGTDGLYYRWVWHAVRSALPVLVVVGVVLLSKRRGADAESPLLRSQTMLLLSAGALFTLVQFPFSAPIYFCYVAPLVALLALALFRYARPMAPAVPVALMLFLIGFAVTRLNTTTIYTMGLWYQAYPQTRSLALPRGGLDVAVEEAETYQGAVRVLQQHARGGYTWASPDAPEIYFLSGLGNPTRTLFDFFDDEAGRSARILSALQQNGVTAIAINGTPSFSGLIPKDLVSALETRYPFSEKVGDFEIRWQ